MGLNKILLLFCVLLFLQACIDISNLDGAETPAYEAEYALALVNSSISLKEILEEYEDVNTLVVDEEGLIHFVYQGDPITKEADEVFEQLANGFPSSVPVLFKNLVVPIGLLLDGISLDRLDFKAGDFVYQIDNPSNVDMTIDFEFTTLVDEGGNPFRFSTVIPAHDGNGAPPLTQNSDNPLDLSGYSLIPQNGSVALKYTATGSDGETLTPTTFNIQFANLDFSFAQGYLGPLLVTGGKDTIDIDFFETYTDGTINFEAPTATFFVENSFGVPTRAVVNSFVVETANGENLEVESPFRESGVDFPYPTIAEMGETKTESFIFDKSNSNIDVLLSSAPVRTYYDVDALINPDENPTIRGYINENSFFKVQLEVDLPLFGSATKFESQDTIDFNIDDNLNNVEEIEFKIVAENELGIDVNMQAFLLDAQGQVLDVIFEEGSQLIRGAQVDDNGVNQEVAQQITFVTYDRSKIDKLVDTKKMMLNIGISTESNSPRSVKIQEDKLINVRIGAILKVSSN